MYVHSAYHWKIHLITVYRLDIENAKDNKPVDIIFKTMMLDVVFGLT